MSNALLGSAGVLIFGVGVHLWGTAAPLMVTWAALTAGIILIFISWPGDD